MTSSFALYMDSALPLGFLSTKDIFVSINHSYEIKTAKGKDKVNNTKEALKPVDYRMGKRKLYLDPNKPKKALSAFFVFLEDFRKTFKKENPNVKAVTVVGKAGGEKWRSMSQAEKAPYQEKAAKRKLAAMRKAEYEKPMKANNGEVTISLNRVASVIPVKDERLSQFPPSVSEDSSGSSNKLPQNNVDQIILEQTLDRKGREHGLGQYHVSVPTFSSAWLMKYKQELDELMVENQFLKDFLRSKFEDFRPPTRHSSLPSPPQI